MAVYGYARVSTLEQARDGHSLGAQRSMLEGFAQSEGLRIERLFVDRGVSGSRPLAERRAGGELLARLRPGDVVFCAKLDRMFRSASDALSTLERLRAGGARLFLKDMGGDVAGRGAASLVFSILAAVAQFERERIAERAAETRARLRAAGRYVGGRVPYGYRLAPGRDAEGRPARFLVEDPAQQAVIARARALRAQGASLRAIRAALAAEGAPLALATLSRLSR